MAETNSKSDQWNHAIEIVGSLPSRGKRPRVVVLVSDTPTEAKLLDQFAAIHLKQEDDDAPIYISRVRATNKATKFAIEGLGDALSTNNSIDIVPVGVTWKPDSAASASWRNTHNWMRLLDTDRLQKQTLRKQPHRACVIIGEFGTKSALIAKHEQRQLSIYHDEKSRTKGFLHFVSMQAALTIERDSRKATGRTVKYPKHVHVGLWGRPAFQAELKKLSEDTETSMEKIKLEARNCMRELIPTMSATHIALTHAFARRMCRMGYDQEFRYDREKFKKLRDLTLTKPTALLWTHKTHVDGLAMLVAAHDEGFPLLHLIGGNNMALPGFGYMLRRAGLVFIRRKIDDPVYKIVLKNYIAFLLEKRFPVSWALEGTRSRNGKLMPPRYGILKYVLEAAHNEALNNLSIVPISVYYDLIAELGDYAAEQSGKPKRKESLAWLAEYVESLKRPLGRISLGIGDVISVDTSADAFSPSGADGAKSFSIELQKLAFKAAVNANKETPITPSSLFALIMTGAAPKAITSQQFEQQAETILNWAKDRNCNMTDELKALERESLISICHSMVDMNIVSRYDKAKEPVYSIASGKQFELAYYRNTSLHFFVAKSIAETALAMVSDVTVGMRLNAFWAAVDQIRDLLKLEFFYPESDQFRKEIDLELNRYDPNWQSTICTEKVTDFLSGMQPLFAHAVLRPFIDAYSIVAEALVSSEVKDVSDEKAVIDFALNLGQQRVLQGIIASEESIGKLVFSNAYKYAKLRGLMDRDDKNLATKRESFRRDLERVGVALEMIKSIAFIRMNDRNVASDPSWLQVV